MKILYSFLTPTFVLNIDEVGITGGDRRFIEIGKRLAHRDAVKVNVMTTPTGRKILLREGWRDVSTLVISVPVLFQRLLAYLSRTNQVAHVIFSYVLCILLVAKMIPSLAEFDIVCSPSDFAPDLVSSFLYRITRSRTAWVAVTYQRIPSPFRRKGSFLVNQISYSAQQVSYRLMKKADLVLVNATNEGREVSNFLRKLGIPFSRIDSVQLGVNHDLLSGLSNQNKIYDACFVAALSPVRGLLDIVPIWKLVVAAKPDATIAVIGRGDKDCEESLKDQVMTGGLSRNIQLLGYLHGSQLFEAMRRARMFVSLNREASWGLAITEAMACGLPVVAYDLSAYDIYERGMIRVALGNHGLFAEAILNLLRDDRRLVRLAEEARNFAKKFDWNDIAEHELQIFTKILSKPELRKLQEVS